MWPTLMVVCQKGASIHSCSYHPMLFKAYATPMHSLQYTANTLSRLSLQIAKAKLVGMGVDGKLVMPPAVAEMILDCMQPYANCWSML